MHNQYFLDLKNFNNYLHEYFYSILFILQTGLQNVVGDHSFSQGISQTVSRHWQESRDVFWLLIFMAHLIVVGSALWVFGLNRFKKKDRLNIDRYTMGFLENKDSLTEDYWPFYAIAGGVGAVLGWTWLLLLAPRANQMMKFSVHLLSTYLAVISVLCFWVEQFFWGVAFAIGTALQCLYFISVIDRLPFTIQRAVKMVRNLPEVTRVASIFMLVMLLWLGLWSFGAAGVVLSVSLFWTGAVLCNVVHIIVSGMVFLVLIHGGQETASMPPKPLMNSLRYAVTTSFGSICYGSLFTAAIRTLRWEIRGLRSKIDHNECLLCCVGFLFHLVEFLVRWFNKYAYVQVFLLHIWLQFLSLLLFMEKNFNHSAKDAWELFQSTGVEALIAYDCSGAVLLMSTLLGGLIAGTCAAIWTRIKHPERVVMVGSTAMLMGMILVIMVVVESAVTTIYICYAEDPLLINRWDAAFFTQISGKLHQRLQHRSARAREVLGPRIDDQIHEAVLA
ncbi:hypothetical protein Pfo_023788 [Paulownia fortunei]|nr:hypothetical protein Pfo_023788 [Paulownia fortunei]